MISDGDEIIAISEDNDTVKLSALASLPLSPDAIRPMETLHSRMPERGLILGWNSKAALIIRELENYVLPGSELVVVCDKEVGEEIKTISQAFTNQQVTFLYGDVSDHLISLMLAQFSENTALYHVFSELFDAIGPELYFKPVNDYIDVSKPVSFCTLVEAARQRGETAVGYRKMSEMNDATKSYGVYTNPKKSELVAFSTADKLVVLADS